MGKRTPRPCQAKMQPPKSNVTHAHVHVGYIQTRCRIIKTAQLEPGTEVNTADFSPDSCYISAWAQAHITLDLSTTQGPKWQEVGVSSHARHAQGEGANILSFTFLLSKEPSIVYSYTPVMNVHNIHTLQVCIHSVWMTELIYSGSGEWEARTCKVNRDTL